MGVFEKVFVKVGVPIPSGVFVLVKVNVGVLYADTLPVGEVVYV